MKIKSRRVPENTPSHEKNRIPAYSLPHPRLVYALPQPDGEVVDSQRPLERQFQESAQKPAALRPPNPTQINFLAFNHFHPSNPLLYKYEKIIRLLDYQCHHEFLLPATEPVVATQEKLQRLAHQKEKILTQTKIATPPGCDFCLRPGKKTACWCSGSARVCIFAVGTFGKRCVSKTVCFGNAKPSPRLRQPLPA